MVDEGVTCDVRPDSFERIVTTERERADFTAHSFTWVLKTFPETRPPLGDKVNHKTFANWRNYFGSNQIELHQKNYVGSKQIGPHQANILHLFLFLAIEDAAPTEPVLLARSFSSLS